MKIDCRQYYEQEKNKFKETILKPSMGILQIGEDSASESYVKGIIRDCKEIGVEYKLSKIKDKSNNDLIASVATCFNYDKELNGIIAVHNTNMNYNKILVHKDKIIDNNCTCEGVFHLLDLMNIDLDGKTITIIGKGSVGKSIIHHLSHSKATILCCNSKTKKELMNNFIQNSDIIISAVGKENLLDGCLFKNNQIVIDVGVTQGTNGLCGDINKSTYDEMDNNNILYTTVPNGVGLMTRISLFNNLFMKGGLEKNYD